MSRPVEDGLRAELGKKWANRLKGRILTDDAIRCIINRHREAIRARNMGPAVQEKQTLRIEIPLVPPSANHYKMPDWVHRRFYVTKEAQAFKDAVAIFARGQSITGKRLNVSIWVWLGKGDRLDAGNVEKVPLDGLEDARVFKNDAAVKELHIYVDRDWENPRTVIEIETL